MKARLALLGCLLAAAGCGGQTESVTTVAAPASSSPAASPTPVPSVGPSPTPRPTNSPVPPAQTGPHFATPQAAMRYLASAWNRGDLTALKHVTDPEARSLLLDMHREAVDLSFDHCTFTKARGDYECFFNHGFPKGYKSKSPVGHAEFTVGPADRPGWYMTYFIECG